jgi:uncharacterized protein (TIGR00297 family)
MLQSLAIALLFSIIIAAAAYWRGSLSPSGAAGALFVGILTFGFGGWEWGVLLGIFFVSSSLLSHYKEDQKQQVAEKFDKGHRRDIGQVLANGGLGAIVALVSAFIPGEQWYLFFVGIMATVTADTWATELGTLSRIPPRLITTGRPVEVGTSGGVSLLGSTVSLAGGVLIGLSAGIIIPTLNPLAMALVGGISGLIGSFFDSLLGATVQQIYYCDHCHKETESKIHKCGHETQPLRGWSWLNNDLVNLISSAVGGSIAIGLGLLAFLDIG